MKCSYNRIITGKLSGYEQATFESDLLIVDLREHLLYR
jgi:hypothetical protein